MIDILRSMIATVAVALAGCWAIVCLCACIYERRLKIVKIIANQMRNVGLLAVLCITVMYGGLKPRGGIANLPTTVPLAFPAGNPSCGAYETDGDFCFTSIKRSLSHVIVSLAWPSGFTFPENVIDLYAIHNLTQTGWVCVASISVNVGSTNEVVSLPDDVLPENSAGRLFLTAGTRHDSDGDGLPDMAERRVYGTSPECDDTDCDGILDGGELDMGLNPRLSDTDGDGLNDSFELFVLGTNPSGGDVLGEWLPRDDGNFVNPLPYAIFAWMP